MREPLYSFAAQCLPGTCKVLSTIPSTKEEKKEVKRERRKEGKKEEKKEGRKERRKLCASRSQLCLLRLWTIRIAV